MSYEIQTRHMADSGNGISIEVVIDGTAMAHTFPKNKGWLEKKWDRRLGSAHPKYIQWFINEYEKRYKDDLGAHTPDKTEEEKIIEERRYVNERIEMSADRELNNEDNQDDNTGDTVDLDKPDTIRKYLKDNMAEGYLSQDEESRIDEFVDKYTEMMSDSGNNDGNKDKLQKILRQVYEGKVQ